MAPIHPEFPSHSFVIRVQAGTTPRQMVTKAGKEMTFYDQIAILDGGGVFNSLRFVIPHRSEAEALDPNKAYQFDVSTFEPGSFNGLDFTFGFNLVELEPYSISGKATLPGKAA